MTRPLIAVFDVGKTNAKLAVVDPALGPGNLERAPAPTTWCRVPAGASSMSWPSKHGCSSRCARAPQRERIAVIVPIAHGAAAVLVDHAGEVLAAPDYEDPCFDEVSAEYAPLRDNYSLTFSPSLPQGLNLGRQLFYLQTRRADTVPARRAPAAVSAVLGVAAVGRRWRPK